MVSASALAVEWEDKASIRRRVHRLQAVSWPVPFIRTPRSCKVEVVGNCQSRDNLKSNVDVLLPAVEKLALRVSVPTCQTHLKELYRLCEVPCSSHLGEIFFLRSVAQGRCGRCRAGNSGAC